MGHDPDNTSVDPSTPVLAVATPEPPIAKRTEPWVPPAVAAVATVEPPVPARLPEPVVYGKRPALIMELPPIVPHPGPIPGVVPLPDPIHVPLVFGMPPSEPELATFVDTWIDLARGDGTVDALYRYWILGREDAEKVYRIRRQIANMGTVQAMQTLLDHLGKHPSNRAFLDTIAK